MNSASFRRCCSGFRRSRSTPLRSLAQPPRSPSARPRLSRSLGAARPEGGQATVELVAAVPALLLAALICLQLLAAGYALTPGRYVGAPAAEEDGEPVGDKIARLTKDLLEALDESARLEQVVREQVERLR